MKTLTFVLFVTIYLHYVFADVIVRISEGLVNGTTAKSRNGRTFFWFTGIPYAEPTGDRRFSNPVPRKPWDGVFQAQGKGNYCPQYDASGNIVGDEDCLILNVYTPRLYKFGEPLLPVMANVHGGGYMNGASNSAEFQPEYLLDKDIVFVSMNYRLGILGFLSTGDSAAPGNFGMKDQVLALKWVQKNIRAFGGDPNRVTLSGESAGGSSVNLHAISDLSTGLFHQYIIQSGSVLSQWAINGTPAYYENPKDVGKKYNCFNNNSHELVNCLRKLSVVQLLNEPAYLDETLVIVKVRWLPTIEPESEDAFLTEWPEELLRKGKMKDLPFITGNVKDEGLLLTAGLYVDENAYKIYKNHPLRVFRSWFRAFPPKRDQNLTELAVKMKNFYLCDAQPKDKSTIIQRYTDFESDSQFFYPQLRLMQQVMKTNKNPFYFYLLEYRGTLSNSMSFTRDNETFGVSHADDLIYLYPINGSYFGLPYPLTLDETDFKIVDLMVDLWTSFVIDGVPSSTRLYENGLVWTPYKVNRSVLHIGNYTEPTASLRHTFFDRRMKFWYENV